MNEVVHKLTTPDGVNIFGVLNRPDSETDTLVIFAHGLMGNPDEHTYYSAKTLFPNNGIATYRFGFYHYAPGYRKLQECAISTHAADLEFVISSFTNQYERIIVVGHSLGALAAMMADTSAVKQLILWDPTVSLDTKDWFEQSSRFNQELDAWVLQWEVAIVLSKELVQEWREINLQQLLSNKTIPVRVISAGKNDYGAEWFTLTADDYEIVTVENADHNFNAGTTEKELLEHTLNWIKK